MRRRTLGGADAASLGGGRDRDETPADGPVNTQLQRAILYV